MGIYGIIIITILRNFKTLKIVFKGYFSSIKIRGNYNAKET